MLSFQGRDTTCQIHFLPIINKIYSIFVLIFQLRKTEKKEHFGPLRNLFYFSTAQNWEILGKKLWYLGFVLVPKCAEQDKLSKTAKNCLYNQFSMTRTFWNIFLLNNILITLFFTVYVFSKMMPEFWQNMYNRGFTKFGIKVAWRLQFLE